MPRHLAPEELLQDHPKVSRDGNPTPDERADFVVRRLEQFIREGRVAGEGMSLRQWQDMARGEIANAILEADLDRRHDATVSKRLLFTLGAAFTTLGFWGALWALGQVYYLISAVVCGLAGIVMLAVSAEWTVRRAYKRNTIAMRADTIRRVESLTRRIRRMERQLKDEADRLEKNVAKAGLKPEGQQE